MICLNIMLFVVVCVVVFMVKLALSVIYMWHFSEHMFEIWMLNRAVSIK